MPVRQRQCPPDMSRVINLWSLRFADGAVERTFRRHHRHYETSWDSTALICVLLLNTSGALLVGKEGSAASAIWYVSLVYSLAVIWPLGLLLSGSRAYLSIQPYLAVGQRLVRVLRLTHRFWPAPLSLPGDPRTTPAYEIHIGRLDVSHHARGAASVILLESIFGLATCLFCHLPFPQHLMFAATTLAIDALLVAPTLSCMLLHPQLQPWVQAACPWLTTAVAGPGVGSMHAAEVCDARGAALFVPALCLLLIGNLAPLAVTYWSQLRLRLRYLRTSRPDLAGCAPGREQLRRLMLLQLQVGLLLAVCAAQLVAVHQPLLSLDQCGSS